MTRNGKMLTAKGVKPVCPYLQAFENTWLFGSFSPITGNSVVMEMPECNSDCFQIFLTDVSKNKPDELKIIILDNGAFHKAKKLTIPENIVLLFLPAYVPELNPAERIWLHYKRNFSNLLCTSIKQVGEFLTHTTHNLNEKTIISMCAYDYIVTALLD